MSRAGCCHDGMPALTSVPRFEPFVGLRYDTSQVDLDDVVAPPYDVLERRRARGAGRPPSRQHRAGRRAAGVRGAGPLRAGGAHAPAVAGRRHPAGRRATRPSRCTAWRSPTRPDGPGPPSGSSARWRSRRRAPSRPTGRACSPTNGRHPRTRPTGSSSPAPRGANLSPIWGLSLAPGLTELLTEPGAPLGSTVDDDGVTHTVELVDDPERLRGHRRRGRRSRGAHRRRPPPLRRQPAVPGGAPGGERWTPRALRPHDDLPGRAGRGAAQRGAHPPPARRPARRPGLARGPDAVVRHRAGRTGDPRAGGVPGGARCAGVRRGRRHRHPAAAAGRSVRRACGTSTPSAWSTRWPTCPTSCATSPGWRPCWPPWPAERPRPPCSCGR